MTLLIKNVLFTLFVPGTVAVYIPMLLAEDRNMPSGPRSVLGVAVLGVGAAIYAWCVWNFAIVGRGTPLPIDAPKRLVVRGLYRYTRNPMYVGVLTVILGWSILFVTSALVVYGLLVAVGFHLLVVLYEEPHLGREFGREYERYRVQVGRWLPRIHRAD